MNLDYRIEEMQLRSREEMVVKVTGERKFGPIRQLQVHVKSRQIEPVTLTLFRNNLFYLQLGEEYRVSVPYKSYTKNGKRYYDFKRMRRLDDIFTGP